MANTTARRFRARSSGAVDSVKEEVVEVAEKLTQSATRLPESPRESPVTFDNDQYTLQDLEAHPLYDEAEFIAQYITSRLTDLSEDESQNSSFNSQWCAKQDAKEVILRREAVIKYLTEKAFVTGSITTSPRPAPPTFSAKTKLASEAPSSPLSSSMPTPLVKNTALDRSTGQALPMWTPNHSRDALSAPSGFVLPDGRPAPRLRWTPSPQQILFSSPAVGIAAVDEESDSESQPASSHNEAEDELALAGRILLRAEENLIEARLRYTRAYVCCRQLREI